MESDSPVEWHMSSGATEYPLALETMEARVAGIADGVPEQRRPFPGS